MEEAVCVRCGRSFPVSLGVHLLEEDRGQRPLHGIGFHCSRCTAEVMAERKGSPFSFLEVAPIAFVGADGRRHVFHFEHKVSEEVAGLLAYELVDGAPGGYHVELLAEPDEPRTSVVARLLDKIHRELARTHIVEDAVVTPGFVIQDMLLRGRIGYDPETDGPSVVVDGRQLDLDTFGELLRSFEGFSFRLEFFFSTDEVP